MAFRHQSRIIMDTTSEQAYDGDAWCRIKKKKSGIVRIRAYVATTSTSRKDASRDFIAEANDWIRADF